MLTTLKKTVSNASNQSMTKSTSITSAPVKAKKLKAAAKKTKPPTPARKTTEKRTLTAGSQAKRNITPAKTAKVKGTGKATAKRQPAAAKKVSQKRLAQYKSRKEPFKQEQPRLKREKVPETNYMLRDYPWSPWNLVISSEKKKNLTPVTVKVGKKNTIVEYSTAKIFKGKTKCQALYEFAVAPEGWMRKRVVYAKICSGFLSAKVSWRKVFFPSKSLKKQIENIVREQYGDIFVRRLIMKKYRKYDTVSSVVKNYDYVWVPGDGVKQYRELKKDDYVISEAMDVD